MIWRKKQRGDPAYIQKRKAAQREKRRRQEHEDHVNAIKAIVNQIESTTSQEQTDDDKRALREKITIGLLIGTVLAALAGDVIFYLTMQDARASLTESERAWAGPQNAKIVGPIEAGKSINIVITVQNSGREPATDFTYFAVPFAFNEKTEGIPLNEKMKNVVEGCFMTKPVQNAQVLYPTNGFGSGFDFPSEFPGASVDQEVTDGTKSLIVAGCIAYSTFEHVKHSAFCYFYNAKRTKAPAVALNLCTGASKAD